MRRPEARRLVALLAALSSQTNFSVGCYCEDELHCQDRCCKRCWPSRVPRSQTRSASSALSMATNKRCSKHKRSSNKHRCCRRPDRRSPARAHRQPESANSKQQKQRKPDRPLALPAAWQPGTKSTTANPREVRCFRAVWALLFGRFRCFGG